MLSGDILGRDDFQNNVFIVVKTVSTSMSLFFCFSCCDSCVFAARIYHCKYRIKIVVSHSGILTRCIRTDIVRLVIYDDFSSGPLPVCISASGPSLASLRPDSLRSSIFNDFGPGLLLGWIPASGLPLASLRPGSLRSFIFHDLGDTWAGFRPPGCLSRVSGQIRSDR